MKKAALAMKAAFFCICYMNYWMISFSMLDPFSEVMRT